MTSPATGGGRHSPSLGFRAPPLSASTLDPLTPAPMPGQTNAQTSAQTTEASSSSSTTTSHPAILKPSAAMTARTKLLQAAAQAESKSRSLLDFNFTIAPAALEVVSVSDQTRIGDTACAVLEGAAAGESVEALVAQLEPRLEALGRAGYEPERIAAAMCHGLVAVHVGATLRDSPPADGSALIVAFHALLLALYAGAAGKVDSNLLPSLLATTGQPAELLAAWVRSHGGALIPPETEAKSVGISLHVSRQGKSADWLAAAIAGVAHGCAAFDERPAPQRQAGYPRYSGLVTTTAGLLPTLKLAEAEALARGIASGMVRGALDDTEALVAHGVTLFEACLGKKGVPTEHLAAVAYGFARGACETRPLAEHAAFKLSLHKQVEALLEDHPFDTAERRTDLRRRIQAWLADDKVAAKALKPAQDVKSAAGKDA